MLDDRLYQFRNRGGDNLYVSFCGDRLVGLLWGACCTMSEKRRDALKKALQKAAPSRAALPNLLAGWELVDVWSEDQLQTRFEFSPADADPRPHDSSHSESRRNRRGTPRPT